MWLLNFFKYFIYNIDFHTPLIEMIKNIYLHQQYSKASYKQRVNDIPAERGTGQGDSFSPLLFNLVMNRII